jgi:hypothetical protein
MTAPSMINSVPTQIRSFTNLGIVDIKSGDGFKKYFTAEHAESAEII